MHARRLIGLAGVAALVFVAVGVNSVPAAAPQRARSCEKLAHLPPKRLVAAYVDETAQIFRVSFSLPDIRSRCSLVGIRRATVYQQLSTGGRFRRNGSGASIKTNAPANVSKVLNAPVDCLATPTATVRAVVELTWLPKRGYANPRPTKTLLGKAQQGCRPAAACETVSAPEPRPSGGYTRPTTALDPAKTWTATVSTSCGTFAIRLDVNQSPNATASIAYLAGQNFFDNTIVHRIAADFLFQGGDPTASGTGGPGYSTVDTPPSNTTYKRGVVAMAKTGQEAPGTAGSQFFVVTASDAGLQPNYAVVGTVSHGMDVVERIGTLGDQSERPTKTVLVRSIRVTSS